MKSTEEIVESVFRRRDQYRKEKRKQMKKTASVLSCFCLLAILGTVIWQYVGIFDNGEDQNTVESPAAVGEYEALKQPEQGRMEDLEGKPSDQENKENSQEKQPARESKENSQEEQPARESKENSQEKLSPSGTEDYAAVEAESSSQETEKDDTEIGDDGREAESPDTAASVGIDRPVTDHPGDTGALTPYEEVWGGSYMDQNGCWVVLLTEDTPENRQMVFDLNPTLSEEGVIFKTANYTLAYLTELMANISRAMGIGKELSFVSTAALREDKNCVEVTMTEEDAGNRERILAFDPIGGAIEIVVSDSNMNILTEELRKDPLPRESESAGN